MNTNEELIRRVTLLIDKGMTMPAEYEENQIAGPLQHDSDLFYEWKSQSLAFLVGTLGVDHVYAKQFEKEVINPSTYYSKPGMSILKAVKQDIEKGYLTNLQTLVSAEIFSDFMGMSKHLLDQGYWHPAASLIGAVLEDSLRTIAKNRGLSVQASDDLASLNGKCSTAKIYNSIASKQIALWTDIRNKADHGEFDRIKSQDVIDMHTGVTRFLMENLK